MYFYFVVSTIDKIELFDYADLLLNLNSDLVSIRICPNTSRSFKTQIKIDSLSVYFEEFANSSEESKLQAFYKLTDFLTLLKLQIPAMIGINKPDYYGELPPVPVVPTKSATLPAIMAIPLPPTIRDPPTICASPTNIYPNIPTVQNPMRLPWKPTFHDDRSSISSSNSSQNMEKIAGSINAMEYTLRFAIGKFRKYDAFCRITR